jgi:hypothetical protein
LIVAFDVLLLLHTPPEVEEPSVTVLPTQANNAPLIVPGSAITVTVREVVQPLPAR